MALVFDENGDVQTTTVDLQDEKVARQWATESASNKPWRSEFRASFAELLREQANSPLRILELGSGPGLLAKRILQDVSVSEYVLFDFSNPMMNMAKEALGDRSEVSYHLGDFKEPDWPKRVSGVFDAIISMQAVHEIRHKKHIPWLYSQAATLLRPGGTLIVSDAEPTSDQSDEARQLASTRKEQEYAMLWAGFEDVQCHKFEHQYYLISAKKP
jgi:SAM-dependent methyltransferase